MNQNPFKSNDDPIHLYIVNAWVNSLNLEDIKKDLASMGLQIPADEVIIEKLTAMDAVLEAYCVYFENS